jgi:hypothetical protein
MQAGREPTHLGGPLSVSVALHFSMLLLVFLIFRDRPQEALPPIYKVDIVAAPPGERAIGEVKTEPTPAQKTPAAPVAPQAAKERAIPLARATPQKSSARSTPVPPVETPMPKTAAPKAGGGPEGGAGTDVATVHTEGVDFPFPGYLNNIVRQIALSFNPGDTNSALRAEVMFLIYRDGTVKIVRFVTRSGSYSFDLEAQGAIESAAPNFGRLPDGFHDDVLPVAFSFDPRVLR